MNSANIGRRTVVLSSARSSECDSSISLTQLQLGAGELPMGHNRLNGFTRCETVETVRRPPHNHPSQEGC